MIPKSLKNLDHAMGDLNDLASILENATQDNEDSFLDIKASSYYSIEDLNHDKNNDPYQYNYKALHINIQSLPSKFSKLKELIGDLAMAGISLDFILICETFLKDNIADQYNIPGYNLVYRNRTQSQRGGIAIYIKNIYNFSMRDDLSIFREGEFESIFIEVKSKDHKAIVGEIYRIPNTNISTSLESYHSILDKLQYYKHTKIIGTDQNINLLNIDSHEKTNDFLTMFYSNSFLPTITKPTRITDHSATLIDNIMLATKLQHPFYQE